MKRLVCVLLLVCIFMVGCSGAPKRYISPKDAYLATIENKEYILTDALDKLVKLREHVLVDLDGVLEHLRAMEDAVAYGVDVLRLP